MKKISILTIAMFLIIAFQMNAQISVNLKVFLEGPFTGTQMNPSLNTAGLIPFSQPYIVSPWYYPGTEQVTLIPNAEIVDWVLIELRETAGGASTSTPDKMIDRQAAFLKVDGNIVGIDGSSLPGFAGTITSNLYVIIWHRNHLPVMSSSPLNETGGIYSWDFTTQLSKAYLNGQKEISTGLFGMIGGDSDGSGLVDVVDINPLWTTEAGNQGYYSSDLNMDSQVNNFDKNDFWEPNVNQATKIPTSTFNCGDDLTDSRDGQVYSTVQIGDQCWMAENLNIGTRIDGGNNQTDNGIIEKYCYNNSEALCDIYGGLYQWSEMMGHVTVAGVTGICPEGWHIPTDDEWCILEQEVDPTITCNSTGWRGMIGGGELKEDGTSHWANPNAGATNNSGFTALPGGIGATGGTFASTGYFGYWWTSCQFDATTAWQRDLYHEVAQIRRLAASSNKFSGYSVRCLKDDTPILPFYNLNILIEPAGAGTATGAGQYEPGEIILLTATANPGWQFANWTDDDGIVSSAPEFSYTMPLQDVTLTANFEEEQSGFNCGDPLIDVRDGKSYATVQLGDQCWMVESLNYGTMIMGNQAMTDNGIVEKYCYNNDEANCTIYGALYQWNEMMQYTTTPGIQGICPEGWHVPTDAEWTALTSYVSSQPEYLCSNNTTYIAKALASTTYWYTSSTSCSIGKTLSANNATGFTGLPAGFRAANGTFNNLNGSLDFWSSTEQLSTTAIRRYMYFSYKDVAANTTDKSKGASVRCVRY